MTENGSGRKSVESRAAKTVREIFESGRPLTYIRSSEEQRVARVLREVAGAHGIACRFGPGASPRECIAMAKTPPRRWNRNPARIARLHHCLPGPGIFHLKDFHEPLRESPEIRRRLRDVYESCLDRRKFVVITSPVRFVPEEVERSILFLELRTPDVIELAEFLREEAPGHQR